MPYKRHDHIALKEKKTYIYKDSFAIRHDVIVYSNKD